MGILLCRESSGRFKNTEDSIFRKQVLNKVPKFYKVLYIINFFSRYNENAGKKLNSIRIPTRQFKIDGKCSTDIAINWNVHNAIKCQ